MSNFALDLRKWADKQKENLDVTTRRILFDVFRGIVTPSPVGNPELWGVNINARKEFKVPRAKKDWQLGFVSDESSSFTMSGAGYIGGRFKGNWQLGIDTIPTGVLDTIDRSDKGKDTIDKLIGQVPEKAGGKLYYIVNNLPYAQRLENGWSTQAPLGMVALTVVKWQTIVEQAVHGAWDRESPGPAAGFGAYPI